MSPFHELRPAALYLQQGRVVEREGETVVRFPRPCGACRGCVAATPAREVPLRWLGTAEPVEPGDQVVLAVPAAALSAVAALLFAVPLAALVGGAWLGGLLAARLAVSADLLAGSMGLACLAVAWISVARQGGVMAAMLQLTVSRQPGGGSREEQDR